MDRFAAKYRDRGLLIVGLQVRRPKDVRSENVIWWLERIRPTVPVFRLGWDPVWPTRTLPWVILFDHEGREAFAGKPERVEPAIVKALAAAPDPVIGGPYVEEKVLAETIAADRADLGKHLARLRSSPDGDAGEERRAMVAAAERWFERRAARIEDHMPGVVERADAWDALAKVYAGDVLGERAAKARDTVRSTPTFSAEKAAEKALSRALAAFRRCPTHGGYFPYHFTRMNYTVIEDPVWVATRVRMHAEFRIQLSRIAEAHPDTHAGEEASELLFAHDVPEIPAEAARDRVERAEGMLKATDGKGRLYEAWLLLVEVREGYLATDDLSKRAGRLLVALQNDRAKELIAAEAEVRALVAEADRLTDEAQRGGSLLSRGTADAIMDRLEDVEKRAGDGTMLARGIRSFVTDLRKSFDGTPQVGVYLDQRFAGPGIRLARVFPGTGAEKVGLVSGDVLLKIGETALLRFDDYTKALAGKKPGETVTVEVRRASGEVVTLDLMLGRRQRRR